jgi:hypothetical protein
MTEAEHVTSLVRGMLGMNTPSSVKTKELNRLTDEVKQLKKKLAKQEEELRARAKQDELQKVLLASIQSEKAEREARAAQAKREARAAPAPKVIRSGERRREERPGGIHVHQRAGLSDPDAGRVQRLAGYHDWTRPKTPLPQLSSHESEGVPITARGLRIDSPKAQTGGRMLPAESVEQARGMFGPMPETLARAARWRAEAEAQCGAPTLKSTKPSATATTLKEDSPGTPPRRYIEVESEPEVVEIKKPPRKPSKKPSRRKPSSSESSSETVEESDDEEAKRSQLCAAMKALKVGKPRTYDGEPEYDRLETWLEEVSDWWNLHGLTKYATMAVMSQLVEKKAKDWYQKTIRGREDKWILEEIGDSILKDLFPVNIVEILRNQFENAKQGNLSIKDWHRDLLRLANHVAHVTQAEIRCRFWNGSALYLRVEWSKANMGPENADTTVDMMLEAGIKHERTHQWQKEEIPGYKGGSTKNGNHTSNQSRGNASGNKHCEGEGQESHQSNQQRNGKFHGHKKKPGGKNGQQNSKPEMSKK